MSMSMPMSLSKFLTLTLTLIITLTLTLIVLYPATRSMPLSMLVFSGRNIPRDGGMPKRAALTKGEVVTWMLFTCQADVEAIDHAAMLTVYSGALGSLVTKLMNKVRGKG